MSHSAITEVDKHYTTAELAERLGVKENTLRVWSNRGTAPKATRINGAVRYAASDVNAWLEQQNKHKEEKAGK